MVNFAILSTAIFLPLSGVAAVLLMPRDEEADTVANLRRIGLWVSGAVLCLAVFVLISFSPSADGFQFVERTSWLGFAGAEYHLGLDGISIWFFFLTALLMPVAMVFVGGHIEHKCREYVIAFLLLETFLLGAFAALDLILFYVFFEGALFPMFLIIGIWGGVERVRAAYTFFLYTLVGSILMLVAILVIADKAATTSVPTLMANAEFAIGLQKWLWLAFFASFAVKTPMWPFHTWLPLAHVEAPTAGSVLLAAILLKMGGYGFLRFSLPLFPEASAYFAPLVITLSVVGIIYGSMMAFAQQDMKKLIAYSSVAHMGFVTLGIFSFRQQGVEGAVMQMVSHALVSAALFFTVGVLYHRLSSRLLKDGGGLAAKMPKCAVLTMIFTMAAVGLPGTSGFIGEFLVLTALWSVGITVTVIATIGVILSAVYMLTFYKRVFYGAEREREGGVTDLTAVEFLLMALFATAILGLGIFPNVVLSLLPNFG